MPSPQPEEPEQPEELVAATFAATLVDEWVRQGVRQAIVAPGSRSTPLALALAEHRGLDVEVHTDERAAAFMALGLGISTGRPAVVLTTSGTAAVELHPAIVEADHACVPLLAVTADRPPELRGVGAPQTIDQIDLFGRSVRWFADPGPPDGRFREGWRHLAADAVAATRSIVPGPVHLNLAFREPLVGSAGALPEPSSEHERPEPPVWGLLDEQLGRVLNAIEGRRGVVVAGGGAARSPADVEAVAALAAALDWPVIADHLSGCRGLPGAVSGVDALLRGVGDDDDLRPEVVVRLGGLLASRILNEWLARSGATQLALHERGRAPDPDGVVTERFHVAIGVAAQALTTASTRRAHPPAPGWSARWRELSTRSGQAIDRALARHGELTEPGAARVALAGVPMGGALVVSSSMPVRDLEWYAPYRDGIDVHSNRGANGIDGVVSTAVGVALTGRPVVALVGDLAFVHDSNALLGLARRGVDLVVVVVHNDGGGIFSFLPQAEAVPAQRFERLFGTPHGTDIAVLAAAHGVAATSVSTLAGLEAALVGWRDRRGVQIIVARSDRAANVAVHRELNAEVAAAVADLG